MKKAGLAIALATAAAIAVLPAKPARADGGATAAIIAGVLVGGAIVNTAACGNVWCGWWWWGPGPAPKYVVAAPWPWPWWWGPTVTVEPKPAKKAKKK
jgi:hypothetical protein